MNIKFVKNKKISLIAGLIIIGVILLMAVAPGLFTGYDPTAQNIDSMLASPGAEHLFGTDNFGRDIFARVVYSARIDLSIGLFAMLVPLIVGTAIGLVAGYYGKRTDMIVMRIVDCFTIFPFMIMVIIIVAVAGAGIRNVFLAIWLIGWKEYTRIVRGQVLSEKNRDYVLAAKCLGYSDARIMFWHILPNVIGNAIIFATSDIIICMMTGASLSFLGLGVQPPTPEWGMMIAEGRGYMSQAPWLSVFPGVMLVITGIGFSLIGDGVTDIIRRNSN